MAYKDGHYAYKSVLLKSVLKAQSCLLKTKHA